MYLHLKEVNQQASVSFCKLSEIRRLSEILEDLDILDMFFSALIVSLKDSSVMSLGARRQTLPLPPIPLSVLSKLE